jgi:hypothetical protein
MRARVRGEGGSEGKDGRAEVNMRAKRSVNAGESRATIGQTCRT